MLRTAGLISDPWSLVGAQNSSSTTFALVLQPEIQFFPAQTKQSQYFVKQGDEDSWTTDFEAHPNNQPSNQEAIFCEESGSVIRKIGLICFILS